MTYTPEHDGSVRTAGEIAADHGFEATMTGGGCLAFERVEEVPHPTAPNAPRLGVHVWMITLDDMTLDGSPSEPIWYLGRYWHEETTANDESSELFGPMTLVEACQRADSIPNPLMDDPTSAIDAAAQAAVDAAIETIAAHIQGRLGIRCGGAAGAFFGRSEQYGHRERIHYRVRLAAEEYCQHEIALAVMDGTP